MIRRPASVCCTTTGFKVVGVFFGISLVVAAMPPCTLAQTATTLAPVTLELTRDGQKVGSTRIPAGQEVQVLETKDGRVKISVSPVVSGWVSLGDVTMSQNEARQVFAVDDSGAVGSPEASAGTAEPPSSTIADKSKGGVRAPSSQLTVREEHTAREYPAHPPDKCRGTGHSFSFQPKIARGQDLEGSEASLRFYVVALRENKEKTAASSALRRVVIGGHSFTEKKKVYEPAVRLLKEVPVPAGDEPIEPITHSYTEAKCSCCRGDRGGEYLGWYAELVSGDQVISKAQSSLDPRATAALKSHLEKISEGTDAAAAVASGGLESQPRAPLEVRNYKLSVAGANVALRRWGAGDKAIIFFNHSGSMDQMVAQQITAFADLIEDGYSVCVWEYPRGFSPFDKIDDALDDAVRGRRSKPLDFSGVASAVVEQVRSKCGVKDVILVGNSLGAGIILWDHDTLSADGETRIVLISPTEMFSPKPSKLEPLKNGIMFANENRDSFVDSAAMKRWISKNKYAEDLQPPLPTGHLILGKNLSLARVPDLISLKAEAAGTP